MRSLSDYQKLVEAEINQFVRSNGSLPLYDPVNYIMQLGGKRIRPSLVFIANDLFKGDANKAGSLALGVEVFHNFTLLHDDIMDKAPLRRGQATVHEKWSENAAILSGDVMFAQAFQLIGKCDSAIQSEVASLFGQTAVEVCEGQQLDMDFEKRNDVSIPEYIEMIRLKTSVLIGCALKMGALCAGAKEDEANHLYNFGVNLGIAFQIQDDILDVFGEQDLVGKQKGGDIIANKKTFLLLQALEDASSTQEAELNTWLSAESYNPTEKVNSVMEVYEAVGVKAKAEKEMEDYFNTALNDLETLSLADDSKSFLIEFAKGLIDRKF